MYKVSIRFFFEGKRREAGARQIGFILPTLATARYLDLPALGKVPAPCLLRQGGTYLPYYAVRTFPRWGRAGLTTFGPAAPVEVQSAVVTGHWSLRW